MGGKRQQYFLVLPRPSLEITRCNIRGYDLSPGPPTSDPQAYSIDNRGRGPGQYCKSKSCPLRHV